MSSTLTGMQPSTLGVRLTLSALLSVLGTSLTRVLGVDPNTTSATQYTLT